MADYINPTAIRPENGWKPQGFLGGMQHSEDRMRYRDVSSLQDYMMKNQAVESGAKLSDYFADAPVRESKRLSDIASNTATAETVGEIKRNELEKGKLDNQLSAGTLASKIAEAAAKASQEGDKSQMSQLATGAAIAKALAAAAGNGPGALAGVLQQLEQSKADPRIVQWFKNSKSPQELMQKAQMINDAFMQADKQYRATMDSTKANNDSRESEGRLNRAKDLEIAQLKKKDAVKSIDQLLQDTLKLKDKERAGAYTFIMNHPDATPQQQAAAQRGYVEAIKAMNLTAPKVSPPMKDKDGNVILPGESQATYGGDFGPGNRNNPNPNVIDFKDLTK